MDLTDFLQARIAEDEADARVAIESDLDRWGRSGFEVRFVSPGSLRGDGLGSPVAYGVTSKPVAHIARHDPARVLAECEAKRAAVELHRTQNVPVLEVRGEVVMSGPQCRTCADWDAEDMDGPPNAPAPCATLRLLARPYADHPAFDLAWRV